MINPEHSMTVFVELLGLIESLHDKLYINEFETSSALLIFIILQSKFYSFVLRSIRAFPEPVLSYCSMCILFTVGVVCPIGFSGLHIFGWSRIISWKKRFVCSVSVHCTVSWLIKVKLFNQLVTQFIMIG